MTFPQISIEIMISNINGKMQLQRIRYATEFKDEAVKQVIDKRHSVVDVSKRLRIAEGVLYA